MTGEDPAQIRVSDVMTSPIVTCAPDVPVADVAALMAGHRIHAVVVRDDRGHPETGDDRWAVLSEFDLVAAARAGDRAAPAGRIAAGPVITIGPDAPVDRAATLMSEYQCTHLLVAVRGRPPAGIISALDIARALVGPPAPEPAAPGPGSGDRVDDGRLVASIGDRLVIRGHHLGEPDRDAEILEVRGEGGTPPFLVRWQADGRVSLLYPGSDARVEHLTAGGGRSG